MQEVSRDEDLTAQRQIEGAEPWKRRAPSPVAQAVAQVLDRITPPFTEQEVEEEREIAGVREFYEGRLREVKDPSRSGWWRFNRHYDRHGYCDNPARGY